MCMYDYVTMNPTTVYNYNTPMKTNKQKFSGNSTICYTLTIPTFFFLIKTTGHDPKGILLNLSTQPSILKEDVVN